MQCYFCDCCEGEADGVRERVDPFSYEVNDEEWIVPMCDDCEQQRADDA